VPFLGSTPNITAASFSATSLTLKPEYGGVTLPSRNTTIPAGTSPAVSAAALGAALLENAGQWNMQLPASTQSPTGLLRPLSFAPVVRSVRGNIRQQIGAGMEAYLELGYHTNHSESLS